MTERALVTVHSDRHRLQRGRSELIDGTLKPCLECPERMDLVLAALAAAGFGPVVQPDADPMQLLARVHDRRYLAFLTAAYDQWVRVRGDYDALPLNWRAPGMRAIEPDHIDGKLSHYSFDAATPITRGTWAAAVSSAATAASGAARLLDDGGPVLALCRPPGHHAGRGYYGGYCFLNNAAVAVEQLRARGLQRLAVLDVDYHHGNGTQDIYYADGDVLMVSIHGHPRMEFPFFSGFSDERGAGRGLGTTLNLPLDAGTAWRSYEPALATALDAVARFGPEALVVSFGADPFIDDPISEFELVREDFARIGAAIATAGLPTLIVFEGGYAVDALGDNTVAFLAGLLGREG